MNQATERIIALLINLIAAFIFLFITKNWMFSFFIFIILLTSSILYYRYFYYRQIGIFKYINNRGTSNNFRDCLNLCHTSIDFLATWGGSIPSLSPNVEKSFNELIERGVKFRFLLLLPGSIGEKNRRKSRGSWLSGQPETDIRWLLNIRKDLGDKKQLFQIALYSQIPIWAMVIIDNKEIILGYYVKGIGRDNPGLILKNLKKNRTTLFNAFKCEYDRIWDDAIKLDDIYQFEDVLIKNGIRSSDGFVISITGPSGSGKTTQCKMLVEKGYGVQSKTVTTRNPRQNEVQTEQYEYVTKNKFDELSQSGKLLCSTIFCNNYYGIRTEMIYNSISNGNILILDTVIPPLVLRSMLGSKVILFFLVTNSKSTLKNRIIKRTDVTEEEIKLRDSETDRLLADITYCDYVINTDCEVDATNNLLCEMIGTIKKTYSEQKKLSLPSQYDNYLSNKYLKNGLL
jgi:guanylate kinase